MRRFFYAVRAALLDSFLPILLYMFVTIVTAVSVAMSVTWAVAIYTIVGSGLSCVAGGGLKSSLWWGDKSQKIAGPIIALVLMILAQWLSAGFSVQLLGYDLGGNLWSVIGFAVTFVFTNKKLTGA
jgi:hypothetical protein